MNRGSIYTAERLQSRSSNYDHDISTIYKILYHGPSIVKAHIIFSELFEKTTRTLHKSARNFRQDHTGKISRTNKSEF